MRAEVRQAEKAGQRRAVFFSAGAAWSCPFQTFFRVFCPLGDALWIQVYHRKTIGKPKENDGFMGFDGI